MSNATVTSSVATLPTTADARKAGKALLGNKADRPSVEQVSSSLMAAAPIYKRGPGRPKLVKTVEELNAEIAATREEMKRQIAELEAQAVVSANPQAAEAYNNMNAAKRAAIRVQTKIDELVDMSDEDKAKLRNDASTEAMSIREAIAELQADLKLAELSASGKFAEAYAIELNHKRSIAESTSKHFKAIADVAGIKIA